MANLYNVENPLYQSQLKHCEQSHMRFRSPWSLEVLHHPVHLCVRPPSVWANVGRAALPVPVFDRFEPGPPVVSLDVSLGLTRDSNPESQELGPAQRELGEEVPVTNWKFENIVMNWRTILRWQPCHSLMCNNYFSISWKQHFAW